jgi:hypothetical protein
MSHRERQARVAGGQRFARRDQLADRPVEAAHVADDAKADLVLVQLHHLLLERAQEQLHQDGHFLGGTAPVLAREGEQREELHAQLGAPAHGRAHGLDTAAVTGDTRQQALLRPAPVAIHDDRDVAGHIAHVRHFARRADVAAQRGRHQIAIRSASLAWRTLSISAM